VSFDLDDFLAMPRLSGLVVSPQGRVMVHSGLPDDDGAKFVIAVLEIDPAGSVRQLTVPRAGVTMVGCTPDGHLLLRDHRADPNRTSSRNDVASLWKLPATGGEAGFVAATPSGVDAVRVARDAGTTVLLSEAFPSAGSLAEDRAKAEAREKADTSALLFEGYPFRHWDRHLGPRAPRLFVLEADGGLRDLTGNVGQALRDAAWDITADGSTILTSWETPTERAETDRDLVAIDVATGERRTLLRDKGVAVGGDFASASVACSPDGRYAAVLRETVPTSATPMDVQLWLVPLNGQAPHRLAANLDLWPDGPVWTPDSSAVLFTADQEGRKPLWRVDIADPDAEPVRLSHAGAFSDIQPAPDGTAVYALRATLAQPPEVVALDPVQSDQQPSVIYAATSSNLPGRVEEVHASAKDGTPLRAWLVLPQEATEPAPLLLMVHGGPEGSSNTWSWRFQPHVFAGHGYAALLPDPAFSTGYGRHMLQRAWPHQSNVPYGDLLALTDAALQRPDLDADRTAVAGGSYGGYMTNWIIGHTDRFRCAVSHAGSWELEAFRNTSDIMLEYDRLLGDPGESRELYREWSPSTYLNRITTPTLVIHGEFDYRVPVSQGLAVYSSLQRRGIRSALLYLPDENHWVLDPGNIRVWYSTFLAWLDHHVLGEPWNRPEIL
jgi:dipeptidyl aminopeptidase/acylaminoacyl peptidase